MTAIAFATCCSLAWGLADFLAGVEARRRPLTTVLALSQTAALAAALVLALATAEALPPPATLLRGLLAGVLLIIAVASFYRSLAEGMMGVVAPIMAMSAGIPVLVGLAGGDRVSALQAAGIVLCAIGAVLATRQPPAVDERDRGRTGGVGFAFLGMLAFGSFLVIFDDASGEALLWSVVSTRVIAVAAVAAVIVATAAVPRVSRAEVPRIAVIGLLDILGLILFALATDSGLLSVVAVLASLFPAVTVVLARMVLDERLARVQQIGIVAAMGGVAALAVA